MGLGVYFDDGGFDYPRRLRRVRLPHSYIEEQSTASIPGLRGVVRVPPEPVVKTKAAVKFPLTTADRRFRQE